MPSQQSIFIEPVEDSSLCCLVGVDMTKAVQVSHCSWPGALLLLAPPFWWCGKSGAHRLQILIFRRHQHKSPHIKVNFTIVGFNKLLSRFLSHKLQQEVKFRTVNQYWPHNIRFLRNGRSTTALAKPVRAIPEAGRWSVLSFHVLEQV